MMQERGEQEEEGYNGDEAGREMRRGVEAHLAQVGAVAALCELRGDAVGTAAA